MSVHIHKVLGYGIADLQTEGDEITDPRVDWDQFSHNWSQWDAWTAQDLWEWLQIPSIKARVLKWAAEESPHLQDSEFSYKILTSLLGRYVKESQYLHPLQECIHWDSESENPKNMVFRCPDHDDWYRVGNIIDHYEGQDIQGPAEGVRMLDTSGIYPYTNGFIRFREPPKALQDRLEKVRESLRKETPGLLSGFLRGHEYNILVGKWDPKMGPMVPYDLLMHLEQDWRPCLPLSIVVMMEFLGCFPGRDMRNSLRPMIYTYWS